MRLADDFPVIGHVRLTVRDVRSGLVLQVVEVHNLRTDAGKVLHAQLLAGEVVQVPSHCAVGSGATAPDAGDTTLEGEIGRLEVTDRDRSENVILYSTFFGSGDCNGTWRKSGLFNADVGGVLSCEALFPIAITKDPTKTVTVDWTVTCG